MIILMILNPTLSLFSQSLLDHPLRLAFNLCFIVLQYFLIFEKIEDILFTKQYFFVVQTSLGVYCSKEKNGVGENKLVVSETKT